MAHRSGTSRYAAKTFFFSFFLLFALIPLLNGILNLRTDSFILRFAWNRLWNSCQRFIREQRFYEIRFIVTPHTDFNVLARLCCFLGRTIKTKIPNKTYNRKENDENDSLIYFSTYSHGLIRQDLGESVNIRSRVLKIKLSTNVLLNLDTSK